jgi:hypothetical protein
MQGSHGADEVVMPVSDKPRGSSTQRRVPQQVTRLLLVFSLAAVVFFIVRSLLVPPTFGEFGHYRGAAVDDIALQPIKYAGGDSCVACHQEVVTQQYKGPHQTVACESCHGPAAAHVASGVAGNTVVPLERTYCPWCHTYDAARPTGFPQIDPAVHNPDLPCSGCHDSHAADLPSVPESCGACHGRTARVMAASLHVAVACTQCHETADAHKVTPRLSRPTTPQTREFCGTCHAPGATGLKEALRVDLTTHYNKYLCSQCHYPHDPEVR